MDGSMAVLVLLGMAVGATLGGIGDLVLGGLLVWLVVTVARLSARVQRLEQAQAGASPVKGTTVPPPAPQVPTTPREPLPPRAKSPAPGARMGARLTGLLDSGRAAVWAGITVLFFGVAFLLKYAADSGWLSVEVRLAAAVAAGLALLAVGWRLRTRRSDYALVLQGGGLGTLYLSVFVALRLYALVGEAAAFALMALVALASAALALIQNARSLMVASAAGGFLAPLLASTGAGSHVALFGWYALLDAGIFAVAWFRAWRVLNLLGFTFTFIIGTVWGVLYYRPEYFATVEPFLILFFLLFTAVALLYAFRRSIDPRHYLDGTLVFGTPLVAVSHQAWLVADYRYGLAWSAAALALFYQGLRLALRRREAVGMLAESYGALSLVFANVTLPLALDARWTVVDWALEGAALVWVGVRQQRVASRLFGLLLLLLSGLAFMDAVAEGQGGVALLNAVFLGALAVTLGSLFAAWQLQRLGAALHSWEQPLPPLLLAWSVLWWLWTGVHEIRAFAPRLLWLNGELLFVGASAWLYSQAQRRLPWSELRPAVIGLLLLLPLLALLQYLGHDQTRPSQHGGLLFWPLTLAALYGALRGQEPALPDAWWRGLHAGALALCGFVVAWELSTWLARLPGSGQTWAALAWGAVPAVLLLTVTLWGARLPWPVGRHWPDYRDWVLLPVAAAGWVWGLDVNLTSDGTVAPLPALPLLNPLDLLQALLLGALALWWRRSRVPRPWLGHGFALGLFLWVTGMVARGVHQWGAVPFTLRALSGSLTFQASLSVAWGALGLATMVMATRRAWRPAWFAGGALMVAVVAKLFLVDLAGSGTLSRIFSFIGAGFLLLLVGYFSPMPPREPLPPDEGQPDETAHEQGEPQEALASEAHAADEHDERAQVDGQQG